ncbi:hypothetical protein HDU67_003672, partial [Dinochytrium kinnereticum]
MSFTGGRHAAGWLRALILLLLGVLAITGIISHASADFVVAKEAGTYGVAPPPTLLA